MIFYGDKMKYLHYLTNPAPCNEIVWEQVSWITYHQVEFEVDDEVWTRVWSRVSTLIDEEIKESTNNLIPPAKK